MQFPVHVNVFGVPVLLHLILEVSAFFVGFRYFLYLRRKGGDTIASKNRTWILIGAMFGAFFGSRLVGGFEDPGQVALAKNLLFYFLQNKTVLGGFLGGLAGVEIVKHFIKEKKSSGDLFTYPMILALMIGRIGCFSMGVYEETYGLPTSLPWGMNLGDGIPRHPVCLYEIIFLILLWINLNWLERKYILESGARFKIFLISYCFFRLLLDFIKPHYTFPFGLSTIQLTCCAGLIYYHRYIISPKKLIVTKKKLISKPAAG